MSKINGNLFIVSAPSGAGKSSLISRLIKDDTEQSCAVSVSHTTRDMRPGEINGQHYHFVSKDEFLTLVDKGEMYEWAEVFGNYYGTSKAAIADTLANGIDVFLDIDWQGARQVKALSPEAIGIFIAPPSKAELERRLRGRNQDSEAVIAGRMAEAVDEISHFNEFDYIVVNDDFECAVSDFKAIMASQRLTQDHQSRRHTELFSSLLEKK